MIVATASTFRNATRYTSTFFQQMAGLRDRLEQRGDHLKLLLCEGDSENGDTIDALQDGAKDFDAEILIRNHGGPVFHEVVDSLRFAQLAYLGNALLRKGRDADVYLRVESDLLWDAETIVNLIDNLQHVDACAPQIYHANTQWYDTFCFIRDSVHFTNEPPYHECLSEEGPLIRLDSAGSILAMRGEVARKIWVPMKDVFIGVCRLIYANGYSVWLDKRLKVTHPWRPGTEPTEAILSAV